MQIRASHCMWLIVGLIRGIGMRQHTAHKTLAVFTSCPFVAPHRTKYCPVRRSQLGILSPSPGRIEVWRGQAFSFPFFLFARLAPVCSGEEGGPRRLGRAPPERSLGTSEKTKTPCLPLGMREGSGGACFSAEQWEVAVHGGRSQWWIGCATG